MLIDWFTVAAQTVNFLILVWLLKRFLYKPILDAIDAREQRIAEELAEADAKRTLANRERDEFEQKNRTFEQQRQAMLEQTTSEVNAERKRLMCEARNDAEELRKKQEQALNLARMQLSEEIVQRTQQEVFEIARKTLKDLANVSLEQQITVAFIKRLQSLDEATKSAFRKTSDAHDNSMIVQTAFEMPDAQKSIIRDAIDTTFSPVEPVAFKTVPHIISGIELASDGRKISWSIADYLSCMQQSMADVLQSRNAIHSGAHSAQSSDNP